MTNEDLKIPEGFDPDAVNLARAIRKQESNGNYDEVGDNGTSRGAYQWQKGTWEAHAKESGLDPNDFSPKNQDMVAYKTIKRLKDAGKNVVQIAAVWNGGDENRYDPNYVTKNGLPSQVPGKYDVPGYTKRVNDYYQQLKQKTNNSSYQAGANLSQNTKSPQLREQMIAQGQPVSVNPEKAAPSLAGQIVRAPLQLAGKFAASLAGIKAAVQDFGDPNQTESKKIQEGGLLEGTGLGNYLGKVYPVGYNEKNTENPSIASSIGTGLEAASYIPIGGGVGTGIEAAKAGAKGLLKQAAKKALVSGVEGAVGGGLQGAGSGMAQSKPFSEVAKDTAIGVGSGAIIGGGLGATGAVLGKGFGLGKTGSKLAGTKLGLTDLGEKEYANELSKLSNEFESKLNLNRTQQKVVDKGMRYHGQSPIQTLIEKDIFPTTEDGVVDTQLMKDKLEHTLDNFTDAADTYAKNDSSLYSAENLKNSLRENLSQQLDDGKISSKEYEKLLKDAEEEIDISVARSKLPTKIENGIESGTLSSKEVNRLRKHSNTLTNWNNPQDKKSYGYALGNAIRDILEKEGMFGSDYRDFNKDWSKYINAKEFIDSLGDRKQFRTPGGFAGKIARLTTAGISIGNKSSLLGALTSLVGLDSAEQLIRNPNFTSVLEKELVKEGNKRFTQPEMADLLRQRIFEKTILKPLKSKTKLLTGGISQGTKNVTQEEIDNAIKEYIKRNPSSLKDIGQGQIGITNETKQGIIQNMRNSKAQYSENK